MDDIARANEVNKAAADRLLNDNDRLRYLVRVQAKRIEWLSNLINFLGDGPEDDIRSQHYQSRIDADEL